MRLPWLGSILVALLALASIAQGVLLYRYGPPAHLFMALAWPAIAAQLLVLLALVRSDSDFLWSSLVVVATSSLTAYSVLTYRQFPAVIEAAVFAIPAGVTVHAIARTKTQPTRLATRRGRIGAFVAALAAMVAGIAAVPIEPPINYSAREMSLRPLHAGCFEIRFGTWFPSWQPGHRISHVDGRYRLDTTLGRQSIREGRTLGMEGGQALIRPGWFPGAAYWVPLDSNSIRLAWNTGFNGVDAIVRRTANGYAGRAYSRTDVVMGLPQPRTRVTATRISCSLVPADSVRVAGAREAYNARMMRRYDSLQAVRKRR